MLPRFGKMCSAWWGRVGAMAGPLLLSCHGRSLSPLANDVIGFGISALQACRTVSLGLDLLRYTSCVL